MQHLGSKTPAKCAVCGKEEGTPGTYPLVIGVGRVCMSCGMGRVRCDVCGEEVKRLTSSRFQGKTLCLKDYMKEIEKYRQHIIKNYEGHRGAARGLHAPRAKEGQEQHALLGSRVRED
jgi:hypothetical protein